MLDNLSGVKAIIFDMDGVLFFSGGAHEKAWKETLESIGIENFSFTQIAGMRTNNAFRKIFSEIGRELSEEELNRLIVDKQTRGWRYLAEESKVVDYSDELITTLGKKYRLALASSAAPRTVEIYLEKAQNPQTFEFCLNGSSVKEAKPSPEIYLLAMEKLGLTPKDCVVVEDAVNGIQSAVSAGIKTIAVSGTDEAQKLLDAGAIHIASNLQEVESLLIENPPQK